jgi:hypothetical protein
MILIFILLNKKLKRKILRINRAYILTKKKSFQNYLTIILQKNNLVSQIVI